MGRASLYLRRCAHFFVWRVQQMRGVPDHFVLRALRALMTGAPDDCNALFLRCGPGAASGWEGALKFSRIFIFFACSLFIPAALKAGALLCRVQLVFVLAPWYNKWAHSLALVIAALILINELPLEIACDQ